MPVILHAIWNKAPLRLSAMAVSVSVWNRRSVRPGPDLEIGERHGGMEDEQSRRVLSEGPPAGTGGKARGRLGGGGGEGAGSRT
eukprot:1984050-Rhodomonas_salina.1